MSGSDGHEPEHDNKTTKKKTPRVNTGTLTMIGLGLGVAYFFFTETARHVNADGGGNASSPNSVNHASAPATGDTPAPPPLTNDEGHQVGVMYSLVVPVHNSPTWGEVDDIDGKFGCFANIPGIDRLYQTDTGDWVPTQPERPEGWRFRSQTENAMALQFFFADTEAGCGDPPD